MHTPRRPISSEVHASACDRGTRLYIGRVEISIGESCAEEAESCVASMKNHHAVPSHVTEDCKASSNGSMSPTSTNRSGNALIGEDGRHEPNESLRLKDQLKVTKRRLIKPYLVLIAHIS